MTSVDTGNASSDKATFDIHGVDYSLANAAINVDLEESVTTLIANEADIEMHEQWIRLLPCRSGAIKKNAGSFRQVLQRLERKL